MSKQPTSQKPGVPAGSKDSSPTKQSFGPGDSKNWKVVEDPAKKTKGKEPEQRPVEEIRLSSKTMVGGPSGINPFGSFGPTATQKPASGSKGVGIQLQKEYPDIPASNSKQLGAALSNLDDLFQTPSYLAAPTKLPEKEPEKPKPVAPLPKVEVEQVVKEESSVVKKNIAYSEHLRTIKENLKFDTKEIHNLMKTRYIPRRFSLAEAEQQLPPADKKVKEIPCLMPLNKLVDKFEVTELAEVNALMQADSKKQQGRPSDPTTAGSSFMSQDSNQGDSGSQNKVFIEDILDVPLLDTEIMASVNSQMGGAFQGTVCAYAVSEKNQTKVIFGTETGELIECVAKEKVAIKKYNLETKVTAIAISPNDDLFVAGSNQSEVLFRKTEGKIAKKQIKNLNQQKISHIVFVDENAVLIGTMFNVYYFTISNYALILEVTMHVVLPRQNSVVMQISPVFFQGIFRVVVCLHDRIHLYGITKEAKKDINIYKVGEDLTDAEVQAATTNNKWPPVMDWINPDPDDIGPGFVLFWKNKIHLVRFHSASYVIERTITMQSKLAWGCLLDNRLVCTVNIGLELEFLSLDRIFSADYTPGHTHSRAPIYSGVLKDSRDTTYMLKYKDKLEDPETEIAMKLPFFQFFRNRLKDTRDSIYLITDKGLMRYRLISLDRLVETYMVKGQHPTALDLVNSIYSGKIFSKPTEREAVALLTPQLIKGYLNSVLNAPETDKHRTLSRCIETLLTANSVEAIFEDLAPKFDAKEFWGEISKLIKKKQIKFIPFDYLSEGAQYLSNEEVMELLKDVDVSEGEDEQAINKMLMIVKKKNIWAYLYKFCLLFPNQAIHLFLSVLASELLVMDKQTKAAIQEEIRMKKPTELTTNFEVYFEGNEPRRLFFRVFWYLILVLAPGHLEQGLPKLLPGNDNVQKQIPDVYTKTLEWLLDGNNSKIVVEACPLLYFEIIYSLCMNMVLLKTPKVLDVLRKIKQIYLKKSEQTNGIRFISSFRATQNLNHEAYPFTVCENILLILEEVLDPKYKSDIAFVGIKLLSNGTHERKFENQEWIASQLLTAVSEYFDDGRYTLNYTPLTSDGFEDLIIQASSYLENFKTMEEVRKEIAAEALKHK